MFCTSLRRRSSTGPLISSLLSPNPAGLQLKESDLRTHDIALPLSKSNRLLFLIVTPSCVTSASLSETLKRMQHFASLTGGTNCAVLFMLSTSIPGKNEPSDSNIAGLIAYVHLTSTLIFGASPTQDECPAPQSTLPSAPPAHLPILPVPSAAYIPDVVRTYQQTLTVPLPVVYAPANLSPSISALEFSKRKPVRAFDLLPYCTVTPPLGEDAAIALTDAYVDLKDLVRGALSAGGAEVSSDSMEGMLGRLDDVLGEQEAQDVRDFWSEEWVAE